MYEYFLRALKAKGLCVADVVRGTGIAKSTMSEWKNGKTVPKIDKIQKIAEFLGVSVDYLLTGKDEPEFVMPEYDPREHELIEKFGILEDSQKKLVLDMINEFASIIQRNPVIDVVKNDFIPEIEMEIMPKDFDTGFCKRMESYSASIIEMLKKKDLTEEQRTEETVKALIQVRDYLIEEINKMSNQNLK